MIRESIAAIGSCSPGSPVIQADPTPAVRQCFTLTVVFWHLDDDLQGETTEKYK